MLKNKMIAIISTAAALALALGCLAGCGTSQPSSSSASNSNASENANAANSNASSESDSSGPITEADPNSEYSSGTHHVKMTLEGYDPIEIELDADAAPITVQHFCELVGDGFYDGLTFYRFVDGFCAQGGSSNFSAASSTDEQTIKGEFSYNGVDNPLADSFKRGTVAMARSSDKDSASTTFFVTMASGANVSSSLNHQYAAFGTIDEDGMKIMDQVLSDYSEAIDDTSMGVISDKDKQAKITSIEIID